ncbi:hypothetical protein TeGR_g1657, partial [Tetraparma gracilis]
GGAKKEMVLERLLRRWDDLKEEDGFKDELKVRGVVLAGGGGGGEEAWVRADSLMDPSHELLAAVFGDDLRGFPAVEFAGQEWLAIWRDLGLKTTVDKATFLKCARQVAESGSVVVPKDHNLAFTKKPMIGDDVCPPQVFWSSLGVVSPVEVATVLGHLRVLVGDGGRVLGQWDFKGAGVVEVFGAVFKYLEENFDKLSPNVGGALKTTPIVPIGMNLVKASSIFFRLPFNLQPLMYELPRWCAGNTLFTKLGVRETPDVADYCAALGSMQEQVGGGVLGPNELAAVLRLSKFLSDAVQS